MTRRIGSVDAPLLFGVSLLFQRERPFFRRQRPGRAA
jgi:hypothetical protein